MIQPLVAVALIAVLVAADVAITVRRHRRSPASPVLSVGVRLSLRCADCSGSIVHHADWCGRGERPANERDPREVRGAAKSRAATRQPAHLRDHRRA